MAINASAIAGALIFLSFSQVGVAMFISIEDQQQIDIAQIYKAIGAAFGLGFLGPFCISTVCAFGFGKWGVKEARQWTMLGVILIPIFALILVIVYILTGYHIVSYIPPPNP